MKRLAVVGLGIVFFWAFLASGCKGSGSGKGADPTDLVATLCAGTVTIENASEQNLLFAAVKGAGSNVAGWLEDSNGKKISDLSFVSAAQQIETTLTANDYALTPGEYSLHYVINGETFTLSKKLDWGAALPRFQTAPPPPTVINRMLSVGPVNVTLANASYYLRIYSGISGYLRSESTPVPGGVLSEYLSGQDIEISVMVVADAIENGQTVATARYLFAKTNY